MGVFKRDGIKSCFILVVLVAILVNKAVSNSVTMPTNVTCLENSMEIELDKNAYSNLTSSSFHLRNSSCLGNVTGNIIKLTTPLNECGTASNQTADTITYENEVIAKSAVVTNSNDTITRHDAVVVPFNCTYQRRKYVAVSFEPQPRVDADEEGFGKFTFLMDLYPDSSYSSAYTSGDYPISVQLNQRLYIKYQVSSSQADLHVFAERCLATTTTSESTSPSYVFLENGCALDQTIEYNYAANREQTFSISSFRFIADHPVVYLHCLLLVCHNSYNNSKCAVGCNNARRRRDVSRVDKESNLYHLSSGPITLKKTTESTGDTSKSTSATVIALSSTVGLLMVGFLALLLLVLLRRRKRSNRNLSDSGSTQLEAYDNPGVNGGDHVGVKTFHQQAADAEDTVL